MGSLSKMIDFLDGTLIEVMEIRQKLEEIQEYFNDNFNNVTKTRTGEITWLQDSFFEDESAFPPEVLASFKKKLPLAEKSFEEELRKLNQQKEKLLKSMAGHDRLREKIITSLKSKNTKLDNREEKLKASVAAYEEELAGYNKRIDELNTGFGFVTNFFRMREIQKEKDRLTENRDVLVDQIEELREKWDAALETMEEKDKEMRETWLKEKAELSMTEEKLTILERDRELLIRRAAFMDTIDDLAGGETFTRTGKDSPPDGCRRCKSDNKSNLYFCRFCGEPFGEDRKDVKGSLGELGELNVAFEDIQKGIRESVSFIALMKGIQKGIEAFTESVEDVRSSQDQYSALPKLKIDVPDKSRTFFEKIKKINEELKVKHKNLHPAEFASYFKSLGEEVFTDKKIESYFTAMGDELDRTTKEQW